jgi:hypothetical protein
MQLQRLGFHTIVLLDSSRHANERRIEILVNHTLELPPESRESELLNGGAITGGNLLVNMLNECWRFEVSQWPERAAALLD